MIKGTSQSKSIIIENSQKLLVFFLWLLIMHRPDFCTISRKWKLFSLTSYLVSNQLISNEEYRLACTLEHFSNVRFFLFYEYRSCRCRPIQNQTFKKN
jgi:hypothetical protein